MDVRKPLDDPTEIKRVTLFQTNLQRNISVHIAEPCNFSLTFNLAKRS